MSCSIAQKLKINNILENLFFFISFPEKTFSQNIQLYPCCKSSSDLPFSLALHSIICKKKPSSNNHCLLLRKGADK